MATRLVFDGDITGVGTAAGHRFVVGRWERSPFGAFADVMHEDPQGHRRLLAPTAAIADFVRTTYRFDEVVVSPLTARREADAVVVAAAGLELTVALGRRTALGWLLHAVPAPLARSPWWCGLIDPIARRVQRGVGTRGTAGGGRTEWYGATDQHAVVAVVARLGGADLGPLTDVHPPVRFGFSSVPRRPTVVSLRTTIAIPDGAGLPGQR